MVTIMVAFLLLVVAVAVPLALPESPGSRANDDFVTQAIVTLILSLFAGFSAVLFLLGLKDFKTDFKKTYYLICIGLITQAIALLVYPTSIYLHALGSSFTSYGGDLFYCIGAVFILAGLVRFARLLKLTTWLRKPIVVGLAAMGLAAILWLVPHSPVEASETYFNLTKSLISVEGILSLLCTLLVLAIRATANRTYSWPLLWLALALFFNTGGEILYYLANHQAEVDGTPHADLASASGVVFLVSRILYIVASYSLINMSRKEEAHQEGAEPVDVIIGMSELASNPAEIDPLMDRLRGVTAASAGKPLTLEQMAVLHDLYFELEEYLVNKEQLRNFTKESLRSRLEHRFGTLKFVSGATAGPAKPVNSMT